jgi:hypothetical protein
LIYLILLLYFFLWGFVEGEGSASISVSTGKEFKYGVNFQPMFNVTQHENGLEILQTFKDLFGSGSLVKKSGTTNIWVYTIKGYKNMNSLIIPFLEKYVQPFSCKTEEFKIFKNVCLKLELGHQKSQNTLIELVKWSNLFIVIKGKVNLELNL